MMLKTVRCALLLLLALIVPAAAVSPDRPSLAPDIGGGLLHKSSLVAANTTAIVIKNGPGLLYSIAAWNNGATVYYGKVYDTAWAICGSGTVSDRFEIPGAAAGGAGFVFHFSDIGVTYQNGITVCITAGYADADTTAPTAGQASFSVYYN